ncbi:hypothetical protein PISMIDRAFT_111991 [Pisolithus microcarpus 441]|uniref:NAD-dependent epimerase/dehydratase domain-containing protein n=1 Tax=Pisolithus microcarpus 441 TaxID=765257 RepID=A0A0C9YKG3_9AGAM|nr:D-lactaldehyde dehydrogenase [Pisolithus microcarpus]KIK17156.1 hypothetical protein PISMIDRAFT_111991 [Pisolithus microcarpus 441]
MPAIQPPSKVVVSGANGFIAMWVMRDLLEHGYSVRGTVRSAQKGEYISKYFAEYGSKLELVVVEDITKEGAFDEAVKGVDAIAHTASPVYTTGDMVGPAVKGTIGILHSALRFGQSIKRIVYTSSGSAVIREVDQPTTFTEEDWNLKAVDAFKEQGDNASNIVKYRTSKVLAEQGAWSFVKEHQHDISWDLTVVNPTFVFGPAIHEVADPTSLNFSARLFYNHVADPAKSDEVAKQSLSNTVYTWIDVRDLSEAHRRALETPEAGGERIIASTGPWSWQNFIDTANSLDPPPQLSKPLPRGNPGVGSQHSCMHYFDNTKSQRILGMKYRSMAEMTRDTFADYEARGW